MRVIVSGARDWDLDKDYIIFRELDKLLAEDPDLELIEGCAHGVDEIAGNHEPGQHEHGLFRGGWAWWNDIPSTHVPANWERFGRAAGPIRNMAMLARNPDLVLAFHWDLSKSKGTNHMVKAALKEGVQVRIVKE